MLAGQCPTDLLSHSKVLQFGAGTTVTVEQDHTSLRTQRQNAIDQRMTRTEALAAYGPIRAGIQRILKAALHACNDADWKRAAKQVGAWSNDRIEVEDESAIDMIADVALFEANQRGKRAYDRFLAAQGSDLEAADLDLANRMRDARFSVFRVAGRHELAGVWLDDVLNRDERMWVLDQGLEASAPDHFELGMRLFDAGPFHAGFGIVVPADEETAGFCAQAAARGNRLPVRHSLAATLYADAIWADTINGSEPEVIAALMDQLDHARRRVRRLG